jgi:curved DNA-binding protein
MFGGRTYTSRGGRSPFGFDGYGTRPRPAKGQDLAYELSVTLEEAAASASKVIAYNDGESQQNISIKIPAGISTGKKLRIPGKGRPGLHGGPRGDLFVQVRVLDHPVFRREGDDLVLTREIKFTEAISGTEIDVPTIDQKTLRLKIPPGCQVNSRFRLKGYGMPVMGGIGRGDAHVLVTVAVPKKLSKKQQDLLKQMEEAGF